MSKMSTGQLAAMTTRVGKYELGRTLGYGNFGKVKYATHVESGKPFALKILDKERVVKRNMTELVKLEISIMKRLKHPNIVELYEVMATKTKIYLVMEYVPGGVLFDEIKRHGKVSEAKARVYFHQLISAVEHCHSHGVYHRDLKPENLLLDAEGNLKVSDFGLSALVSHQMSSRDGLLHTTCGTPHYMAPEVFASKGYDGAKADVWSSGVILFALMACGLPFDDQNIAVLCRKICMAPLGFPRWFSPGARSLIRRILTRDPQKRMSVGDIIQHPWFREGHDQSSEKESNIVRHSSLDNCQDLSQITDDVCATLRLNSCTGSSTSSTESDISCNSEEKQRPALLNAFELISSLNKGLDLSGLLVTKYEHVEMESRFASKHPAPLIVSKIEETAKPLGFSVHKHETYKMKLHQVNVDRDRIRSRNDLLSIAAEIFEIGPALFLVEVKKDAGDALEYRKFYQNFSNGLKDIVWTADHVVAG